MTAGGRVSIIWRRMRLGYGQEAADDLLQRLRAVPEFARRLKDAERRTDSSISLGTLRDPAVLDALLNAIDGALLSR
jgi:hypothetical protein